MAFIVRYSLNRSLHGRSRYCTVLPSYLSNTAPAWRVREQFFMYKGIAALSLFLLSTTALAAEKDDKKWNVAQPPVKSRQVKIDVSEGTWMNLDVSPDGRTIAFDLLGDIYTMPIGGGTPTRVAEGLPFEMQPRFSPDGTKIAFTSDRGGGDNIWIMNLDGSGKRQLTKESFTLLNNPTWSPDGNYIAARKHFTTQRSAGTGEVWMYHVAGGGGVSLVERPNPQHQKELGEPTFTPDGSGLYFSLDTTPGGTFQYAQNSNDQLFAIERYDMKTGERSTVAGGPGGAVRPTPSPDGRWLAFVKRERAKSKLYIKDLRSGEERKIYDHLDQDMQETWAIAGLYPNMDWTPDSRSIVFWAGGKIHRVDADGSNLAEIPFHVADGRSVIDPVRPAVNVYSDSFTTKMPRFASLSPDGRKVVFASLGRLHVKDVNGGTPRPLTAQDGDFQIFPSWSRDGSRIVFVSWNDQRLGEIRTVAADGSDMRTITRTPGHYRRPRFSPDGQTIVFERGSGGYLTSDAWSGDPGVFRVSAGGGEATRLTKEGGNPHFGASNDRIFMEVSEDRKLKLVSVDRNGTDKRVHAQGDMVVGYEVSPTGDWLAFRENYNAFIMPFFGGAETVDAGAKASQLPVTRVSGDGGQYLHWGTGGRTLAWSLGPTLYSADAATVIRAGGDTSFTAPKSGVSLAMTVAADKPKGLVALTGAKIITMSDANGGVIEDGVILIEDNRIRAVGPRSSVAIPAGAQQVDLAGRQLGGIVGQAMAEADGAQLLGGGREGMVLAGQFQRHGDILVRRHGGQEVEGLEDDAEAAAARAGEAVLVEGGEVGARDADRTGGGALETRQDGHERRLARAGGAEEGDAVAPGDLEVDAAEDVDSPCAIAKRQSDIRRVDDVGIGHEGSGIPDVVTVGIWCAAPVCPLRFVAARGRLGPGAGPGRQDTRFR